MSALRIDESLCSQCGICSTVCTSGVLIQSGGDGLPQVNDANAKMCIGCGHCEAYCPSGALHRGDPSGERANASSAASHPIASGDLGAYLQNRRSVRWYTEAPVPKARILEMLDIVRYAPSAGNGQPVEWIVVCEAAMVKRVAASTIEWMKTLIGSPHPMGRYVPLLVRAWEAGRDVVCRGAPHLLVSHIPENNPVAQTDAVIAMTHFDAAAPAFGLGTCWAGFIAAAAAADPSVRELLGVPAGRRVGYAMMFGVPRVLPHRAPQRKSLRITWK